MSLTKIVSLGDDIKFSLNGKEVTIQVMVKMGRQVVLKIDADRSIGILVVSKSKIWVGTPTG
jgi:hypothetical protein